MSEETMGEDAKMECVDCKVEFVFTAGERDFYVQRSLSMPKRCKPCRKRKRNEMEEKRRQERDAAGA